eukprot:1161913-Pelagomonas_calceolata.AAC.12
MAHLCIKNKRLDVAGEVSLRIDGKVDIGEMMGTFSTQQTIQGVMSCMNGLVISCEDNSGIDKEGLPRFRWTWKVPSWLGHGRAYYQADAYLLTKMYTFCAFGAPDCIMLVFAVAQDTVQYAIVENSVFG